MTRIEWVCNFAREELESLEFWVIHELEQILSMEPWSYADCVKVGLNLPAISVSLLISQSPMRVPDFCQLGP